MKKVIKTVYVEEMKAAKEAYKLNDYSDAFYHLERAHILGQRFFISHLETHWWMLKVGIKKVDIKEILGQILRLIAVIPGYLFGWVPKGNTGGANVSALKPMEIPQDLRALLKDYSVWKDVFIRIGLFTAFLLIISVYKTNALF